MNKKVTITSLIILVAIAVAVLLTGKKEEQALKTDKQVTITHKMGTTTLDKNPKRIVVFDWAMLDTLDALGINGILGVPQSATIPTYLDKFSSSDYTNIGGLKDPNLEKINELEPDLILINGRQESFYDKLNKIAPTISMSKENGAYTESVYKNLRKIGEIFGKESEVEAEIKKVEERLAKLEEQTKGLVSTTIMASKGELSVFGEGSRFGLINEAGFKASDDNIEFSTHGQQVSFEYLASQDADYIFVVDKSTISSNKAEKKAADLLNNDLVNNTKAAKNNHIIYLDTAVWYLADGGIMSLNKAIDEIEGALK